VLDLIERLLGERMLALTLTDENLARIFSGIVHARYV
jgi:hypothetical protein